MLAKRGMWRNKAILHIYLIKPLATRRLDCDIELVLLNFKTLNFKIIYQW